MPAKPLAISPRLVSKRIVRSYELDSFGHVNNAVYLQYCEGARNDYMHQRGLRFSDFQRWQVGPILHRAEINYKYPAKADDALLIEGVLTVTGRSRFQIDHEIFLEEDRTLVCQASLAFAFVHLQTNRVERAPTPFLHAFAAEPVSPAS